MKHEYSIKSISALSIGGESAITNIDTTSNVVEGYFSIFGNVDSDGDMIMPGAFTKTLQENGNRIKHLWQHDPRYPLSKPVLQEDAKGLKFKSTISDTSFGRDAMRLYMDGVIDEHSIGYNTIKAAQKSNYNEMTELRLWEGSSVTWGANDLAIGGPMKGLFNKEDIIKRMDTIYKALRHGKYENDEIFILLDINHQQLKQVIIDLLEATPAVEKTPEPSESKEPNNEVVKAKLNSLINLFK
jgi:HK97 family phage prohead protease